MMGLDQKVAIITGAAHGIGHASALLFARHGARVVATDLDVVAGERVPVEIQDMGGEAVFVGADVSRAADVQRLLRSALDAYGRADILFNVAGVHLPKDAESTSEEEWDYILATNVKSVFLTVKYAVAHLKKTRGAIINMASMVGLVGQRNSAAYSASKGAIVALTKSLALDYAPYGVRVNCICPAGVATPLLERWIEGQADPQQVRTELDRIHPLGWTAQPEEIAAAALFLASSDASFVTGVALPVDGGAGLGYRA